MERQISYKEATTATGNDFSLATIKTVENLSSADKTTDNLKN